MAENAASVFTDEDDDHEDWLELHNTSATNTVSLNGWYLRDGQNTWRFPVVAPVVSLPPGGRLTVWCSGKDRKADAARLHTDFKLGRTGEYLGLLRDDGLTVEHEYAPAYPVQAADKTYGLPGAATWVPLIGPADGAASYTLAAKARVPLSAAEQNQDWTSVAYADGGWASRSIGLEGGIYKGIGFDSTGGRSFLVHSAGRVQANPDPVVMLNTNACLHLRFPFTLANAAQAQALQLRVNYEDGFIAHLNGHKILEASAPATPLYNSAATADREDDQCEDPEVFNLPGAQAHLLDGANVLAVQAFNNSSGNALFLFTPALEARMPAPAGTNTVGYLQTPTPGAENTVITTALGPDLSGTTRNPPRPPAAANLPFTVTTTARATLNPVQSVTLYYRRMHDAEASLPMTAAGNGAYSAVIPGSFMQTLGVSQMLRWRVEAVDSAGNRAKDPPYADPRDNDQYFGVITQTPGLVSSLPVLFWFSSTESTYNGQGNHSFAQAASNTRAGKAGSFYFLEAGATEGRFYDNVRFGQHGQSTGGFDKKSQNVNFNRDNPFRWRAGEKEVTSFNLLSNYADKSKVRNTLAWEFWNTTRHPSHWCQPVRVQQIIPATLNGGVDAQFYGIWDMTEDGNADFLERWGLDRDGALYKCYNSLDNSSQTANNSSGVEKKTREWEDFSDLAALVSALNPGTAATTIGNRRRWVYDNVDVPALINMLAAHAFIRSNDYGHKNYYIYRDTRGTGEWTLLPWDQDLSFGHTWIGGPGYFDDDIDSARGLVVGNTAANRLMRLVAADYGLSQELPRMYLRRLRTLMDTYLGPESAPVSHFEARVAHWQNRMDPTAGGFAAGTDDADRDFRKWGFWLDGSGASLPHTDAGAPDHFLRAHGLRITTSNPVPPYPGAEPNSLFGSNAVHHTSLPAFLPGRRSYLYRVDADRPKLGATLFIPEAQPALPPVVIENVNFNPGAAGQAGEFLVLRNTGAEAVDISDWRVAGEIEHTFRPGTVLPGVNTPTSDVGSQAYVNQLILAKNSAAFRARAVSPKGGEYRLVQGGYRGQLSARGGVVELLRPDDPLNLAASGYSLVASNRYAGAATPAQQYLRISEIHYAPADPDIGELQLQPLVEAGDFEFIELVNAGPAPLVLPGASFQKGIVFVFPSAPVSTLAPGERRLVVRNLTAFRLRHGTSRDALILGEFSGSLDNAGEELQLVDEQGEVVLEFRYEPGWYPPTDKGGHSLVTRVAGTAHNTYDEPTAWGIGLTVNGTPGGADAELAQVYEGWRWDHFAAAEVSPTSAVSALTADPDLDGRNNLFEYAFGGAPRAADESGRLEVRPLVGGNRLTFAYLRARHALDLVYTVEFNPDPANPSGWTTAEVSEESVENLGDGRERVVVRESAVAEAPGGVMRVRVEKVW